MFYSVISVKMAIGIGISIGISIGIGIGIRIGNVITKASLDKTVNNNKSIQNNTSISLMKDDVNDYGFSDKKPEKEEVSSNDIEELSLEDYKKKYPYL